MFRVTPLVRKETTAISQVGHFIPVYTRLCGVKYPCRERVYHFTFTFEKPVVFTHAHARATPATARVDARRDLHTHRPGRRERGDWALVYGIYTNTHQKAHTERIRLQRREGENEVRGVRGALTKDDDGGAGEGDDDHDVGCDAARGGGEAAREGCGRREEGGEAGKKEAKKKHLTIRIQAAAQQEQEERASRRAMEEQRAEEEWAKELAAVQVILPPPPPCSLSPAPPTAPSPPPHAH